MHRMKRQFLMVLFLMLSSILLDAQQVFLDTNGKYGLTDDDGKIILNGQYDQINIPYMSAPPFSVKLESKWGYINKIGKLIIPLKYEEANEFAKARAAVKLKGKWGFIDKSDNVIAAFRYEEVKEFSDAFAAVKLKGKWGYIDKTGYVIIPFKYNFASRFIKGEAEVDLNGKTIIINKKGKNLNKSYSPEISPWY